MKAGLSRKCKLKSMLMKADVVSRMKSPSKQRNLPCYWGKLSVILWQLFHWYNPQTQSETDYQSLNLF